MTNGTCSLSLPNRFQVLDCLISHVNMQHATRVVLDRLISKEGGYVTFCNVHLAVTAHTDQKLRDIINHSFMAMPDGKPLSLTAKLRGLKDVDRVAGPDFMPHLLKNTHGLRHFFYGATAKTLSQLDAKIRQINPEAAIAGTYAPPFREIGARESEHVLQMIRATRPDIIWVGLGAPKQEYWMADHWQELRPALLMGVGAAFDFYAEVISRAPRWMHRLSLEWLYRFSQEPKRLAKRYSVTNSLFIFYIAHNWMTRRR